MTRLGMGERLVLLLSLCWDSSDAPPCAGGIAGVPEVRLVPVVS